MVNILHSDSQTCNNQNYRHVPRIFLQFQIVSHLFVDENCVKKRKLSL